MSHSEATKKANIRIKAKTMLDVFKELGKIHLCETYKRLHPNCAESSKFNGSRDLSQPEVYAEFIRLLRCDEKAVAKLNPSAIVQNVLSDLDMIDKMLESAELSVEETNKLLNTKSMKQKLLGSYLGIWNAEKENPKPPTDPDALFQGSRLLSEGLN